MNAYLCLTTRTTRNSLVREYVFEGEKVHDLKAKLVEPG